MIKAFDIKCGFTIVTKKDLVDTEIYTKVVNTHSFTDKNYEIAISELASLAKQHRPRDATTFWIIAGCGLSETSDIGPTFSKPVDF